MDKGLMQGMVRLCRHARRLRALPGDARGTSVIEFAIIALPLITLLLVILETALVFLVQQNLETAAERTVRQIMTGTVQRSGMSQAQFKNMLCGNLPSFMQCSNVMVDVRVATSFADAQTGTPAVTYDSSGNPNNVWAFQPGGSGDIVVMRSMYVWSAVTAPMGFNLSNLTGNRRLMVATNVVKTEPY